MAEVLRQLGTEHCLVVHGEDGLDEISLAGRTRISELRHGEIRTYTLAPEDVGLERRGIETLRGGDRETNARIAIDVLDGRPGPAREIVQLNAGAAIYVGGGASCIAEGLALAGQAIDSGRARATLDALRATAADTLADGNRD